jgi:cell pole-organizing protein PopZ
MTTHVPDKADPSMEDILASIRDILQEDEAGTSPLELTEAMLVTPPPRPAAPMAEPERPSVVVEPPVTVDMPTPPAPEAAAPPQATSLLAPAVAAAAAAALGELARAVAADRTAPISRGNASIEDVVREEIRPLLKAWLDEHLPGMVEHIVKAEIARLMGRNAG